MNSRVWLRAIGLLAVGVLVLNISLVGCDTSSEPIEPLNDFKKLEATDFDGNTIDSDIFADYDATVVNFWYTECSPCIEEMPYLESMYQEFKEENINLIGIATDISKKEKIFEVAQDIIETQGVTFKNLRPVADSEFEIGFMDNVTSFPTTYIIDSDGEIMGGPITGRLNDWHKEKIKEIIDEALNASSN